MDIQDFAVVIIMDRVCANINESSIKEVWNVVKKEQRRIQLAGEWDKLPEFCRTCEDWCGGYAKYE